MRVAQAPAPAAVGVALLLLPFAFLGYGNDIDVANVLRSGRGWLAGHGYAVSRPPGAPVHELVTGVLDSLGGSVAIALGSVGLGVVVLLAVSALVGRGPDRWPLLGAAALLANPWFIIAATSLNDALWALGLALGACVAARNDQRVLSGVLFGLAIGCRSSILLLAGAWLLAERTGVPSGRVAWRSTLRTTAVLVGVAVVCFVPPWWAAGRSVGFLELHIDFVGWGSHLGRWAVKNLAVATVPGALILLAAGPAFVDALRRWSTDLIVRFAVIGLVAGELLFFRLPLKPVHLLPVVVAVVLLASVSGRKAVLVALIGAQLLGGVVATTIAGPDVPHRAEGGSLDLGVVAGPLVNDVRCRWRDRELGPWPDPDTPAAIERAFTNFDCQNGTWRADAASSPRPSGRATIDG